MDVLRARRLLLKIQTFLDQDPQQELSRLEKDLVKSYILQLYESVQSEDSVVNEGGTKSFEAPVKPKTEIPKTEIPRTEKPPVQIIEPVMEIPKVTIPEIKLQKPEEVPVEINYPAPEIISTPKMEYHPSKPPVVEPIKEETYKAPPVTDHKSENADEALRNLFEQQKKDDLPERFSHVPISSIESAMGLNERIFTLNELFGGDKALFDRTCEQLNQLQSFDEARMVLMNGPARFYHWGEAQRLKMAEQFIRIVARRYPKGH